MHDESEELKKLKGDFALTLEVLRCVLRKSQGIQANGDELKRANGILSVLLEQYEVLPIPPVRNGKGNRNCFISSKMLMFAHEPRAES